MSQQGWAFQGPTAAMTTSWDIPSESSSAQPTGIGSLSGLQQDEKPREERGPGEESLAELEAQRPHPSQAPVL